MQRFPSPSGVRTTRSPEQFARGLGWLSLGLGVAQLLAPKVLSRIAGVPVPGTLVMLCGARDVLCGIGMLAQEQQAPWLKARVAGDAIDIAALAGALLVPGLPKRRIGVSAALAGGIAAADLYGLQQLSAHGRRVPPRHVAASIDIARPPEDIYRFWRNPENLPRLMPHLDSVQVLDELHSHWVARGQGGQRTEWDSEIIDDAPNQRLAWRSVDGSLIYNAGSLQLEPLGAGVTRLRVELLYDAPPESLASAIVRLFGGEPGGDVRADLRAFKHLIESSPAEGPGSPL